MAGPLARLRAWFGSLTGPAPDYAALWAELEPRLAPVRRDAWWPECDDDPDEAPARSDDADAADELVDGSRFGGLPALRAGEAWPTCAKCRKAMPFFFQLSAGDLPEAALPSFPDGLLQLFFCIRCMSWKPFSDRLLLRVIAPGEELELAPSCAARTELPRRRVTGWAPCDDYDEPEGGFPPEVGAVDEEQLESMFESGHPAQGDKILGWPYWVQDPDYPDCTECGEPLRNLVQLDSNDHLDFMWGDAGVAHVLGCPRHPDVLALVWQCH